MGGKRIYKAGAFTLIEMLVVIAIIGILASMLMPSMQKALDQSRQVSCLNNLRQLGIAAVKYASDSSGMFPAPRVGLYYWSNNLCDLDYAQESQMFMCPSYGTRKYTNNSNACYSYGVCRDLTRSKLSEVVMPSQNIFKRYGTGPGGTWFFGDSAGMGWWSKLQQCFMISWNTGTNFNAHFRHENRASFWYLDGHAEAVGLEDAADRSKLFPEFMRAYDMNDTALNF